MERWVWEGEKDRWASARWGCEGRQVMKVVVAGEETKVLLRSVREGKHDVRASRRGGCWVRSGSEGSGEVGAGCEEGVRV